MFSANDVIATVITGGVVVSLLKIWEQTAKRGVFEQELNRKLVHITVGLTFMLCWPMFSSGRRGAICASLIPGINIIKTLLIGLGILKDDASVKSMSRFGNHRELLKGPLYYASTITLASALYWRTSPISIAAVCTLCAGDGMANVVGKRFHSQKLPYNRNKSVIGSVSMACAGFLASIGYMLYFSRFGYIEGSPGMVLGFLIVSVATALVESHPLSTALDDNLTVPLTAALVGSLVLDHGCGSTPYPVCFPSVGNCRRGVFRGGFVQSLWEVNVINRFSVFKYFNRDISGLEFRLNYDETPDHLYLG